MWAGSKNEIPQWQHEEGALRVIREAVQDDEFDPREREEFRQALELLSENGAYSKAVWMIQKGMHDNDLQLFLSGIERLS